MKKRRRILLFTTQAGVDLRRKRRGISGQLVEPAEDTGKLPRADGQPSVSSRCVGATRPTSETGAWKRAEGGLGTVPSASPVYEYTSNRWLIGLIRL